MLARTDRCEIIKIKTKTIQFKIKAKPNELHFIFAFIFSKLLRWSLCTCRKNCVVDSSSPAHCQTNKQTARYAHSCHYTTTEYSLLALSSSYLLSFWFSRALFIFVWLWSSSHASLQFDEHFNVQVALVA